MATDDVSPERPLQESMSLEGRRRREREPAEFIGNASAGLHRVGADGTPLWAGPDPPGYAGEECIGRCEAIKPNDA